MMRHELLKHAFVEHIPEKVEPGILYVSMEYGTAAHSCYCGCGEEVVTPFTPTDWKMIFDGETVSLNPSIGNWTLDCRAHYVITAGNGTAHFSLFALRAFVRGTWASSPPAPGPKFSLFLNRSLRSHD